MEERISGFLDAVWDEGISYREACVQRYTNKQFITLLQTHPYIDGIVASSDKVATELIRSDQISKYTYTRKFKNYWTEWEYRE